MPLRGLHDHPSACLGQTVLVRVHGHVGEDFLDNLPLGCLVETEPAREPVQAPHHVLDRFALMRGFGIITHPFTGCASRIAVRTMLRFQTVSSVFSASLARVSMRNILIKSRVQFFVSGYALVTMPAKTSSVAAVRSSSVTSLALKRSATVGLVAMAESYRRRPQPSMSPIRV